MKNSLILVFLCNLIYNNPLIAQQPLKTEAKKHSQIVTSHNIPHKVVNKIAVCSNKPEFKKNTKPNMKENNLAIYAVDGLTGKVLFSKKAYETRYPASLTKLMTLYILFEKLDNNSISLQNKINFSHYAAAKPASKLNICAGDSITIKEAIDALIVLSANDVATALGENLGGSEANFSKMMNKKARDLKMNATHFSNASGLFHPAQHTTAADMVRLGIALRTDFPQYYKYFSNTEFNFRGRTIHGHNLITKDYEGAEGLKTGYISQSGYNMISSAKRNKKLVFATVLGGKTASERDLYMRKLLDASFSKMEKNKAKV